MERTILAIDLKSFFASCECIERGLDPMKVPLVVADISRGGGSITLAVTPFLKARGVPSRCRVFEIPKFNDIEIIYAKPRMKIYLEKSMDVLRCYFDYFSEDDIYVYSVDEVFIDVTTYLKLYQKDPYELALEVMQHVYNQTGLLSAAGIGENMLLAKFALDIDAKHQKNSISWWKKSELNTKLWPIKDLTKVWGIGERTKIRLNKLGIYTMGQLAVFDRDVMKKEMGIVGVELIDHANGIDDTIISLHKTVMMPKSFGKGQTLFDDYQKDTIGVLFEEMLDELCMKLRLNNYVADTISVHIAYSKGKRLSSYSRSLKLDYGTDVTSVWVNIVNHFIEEDCLDVDIRKVAVSLSNISVKKSIQLSLFDDYNEELSILTAKDNVVNKYGKNSITYASSLLAHSTFKQRNKMIGGHNES